jgi:hypothetical protein
MLLSTIESHIIVLLKMKKGAIEWKEEKERERARERERERERDLLFSTGRTVRRITIDRKRT